MLWCAGQRPQQRDLILQRRSLQNFIGGNTWIGVYRRSVIVEMPGLWWVRGVNTWSGMLLLWWLQWWLQWWCSTRVSRRYIVCSGGVYLCAVSEGCTR